LQSRDESQGRKSKKERRVIEKMGITKKVEVVSCEVCGKLYSRFIKGLKGRVPRSACARPSTTFTCSKECSIIRKRKK